MFEQLVVIISFFVGIILYPVQMSEEGLKHRAAIVEHAITKEVRQKSFHEESYQEASDNLTTDWWKKAVFYHVYIRSFKDSNDDGIGDLRGLISKLDYLSTTLGIEALWLSPIHPTPNKDWGYDVSDYYGINHEYGTIEDFEKLIKQCEKKNIKIILDLVVNHTSLEHPWFKESISSKDNPKRNWYIWSEGRGSMPPNNWQARPAGAGSSWKFDEASRQWYLCSFLEHQPDLNWRNKEVRTEIENIMKFWLEKGVSGFRLDIANYFLKDEQLRNNPSSRIKRFCYGTCLGYEYQAQEHIYDKNYIGDEQNLGLMDLFRKLRKLADHYDAVLLGEIDDEEGHVGNSRMSSFAYGPKNDALHLSLNFDIFKAPTRARDFQNAFSEWNSYLHQGAKAVYAFSNHDKERLVSRLKNEDLARLFAVWQLSSDAVPIIYYGDEIGMKHAVISKEDQRDPLWGMAPRIIKSFISNRDGARTPMQWSSGEHAGFTDHGKPWLTVAHNFRHTNVEAQLEQNSSMLSLYRNLLALRKEYAVFREGHQEFLELGNMNVVGYLRTSSDEEIIVLLNFSAKKQSVILPAEAHSIFRTKSVISEQVMRRVELQPFEAAILIK